MLLLAKIKQKLQQGKKDSAIVIGSIKENSKDNLIKRKINERKHRELNNFLFRLKDNKKPYGCNTSPMHNTPVGIKNVEISIEVLSTLKHQTKALQFITMKKSAY